MSTSISVVEEVAACDFNEFKRRAAEFFRKLPGCSEDQREAGFRALALSYLYMNGNDNERHQSVIVMELACRKLNQ